jgi:hypothetical protein
VVLGKGVSSATSEKFAHIAKDFSLFSRYFKEFQAASDSGSVSHYSLNL